MYFSVRVLHLPVAADSDHAAGSAVQLFIPVSQKWTHIVRQQVYSEWHVQFVPPWQSRWQWHDAASNGLWSIHRLHNHTRLVTDNSKRHEGALNICSFTRKWCHFEYTISSYSLLYSSHRSVSFFGQWLACLHNYHAFVPFANSQ